MGQNDFVESFIELMLSWMRWLTNRFWGLLRGGVPGGFLAWFSDNWLNLAASLIIAGLIADWLVWMLRWRPYWLWLHKKQIVYEDVDAKRRRSRAQAQEPPRFHGVRSQERAPALAREVYEDPFADVSEALPEEEYESDPFAVPERPAYRPIHVTPFQPPKRTKAPGEFQSVLPHREEWDSGEDPYADDAPAAGKARPADTGGRRA